MQRERLGLALRPWLRLDPAGEERNAGGGDEVG